MPSAACQVNSTGVLNQKLSQNVYTRKEKRRGNACTDLQTQARTCAHTHVQTLMRKHAHSPTFVHTPHIQTLQTHTETHSDTDTDTQTHRHTDTDTDTDLSLIHI